METKAVFYILKSIDLKARNICACRLIDKAYQAGKRVYVYVETPEEAEQLNTQLWTFSDISFVPHEVSVQGINAPIAIGWEEPSPGFEVLMNLTSRIPFFFATFNHIIEIVPDINEIKIKSREKYKNYQGQNIKLETHEV
jgi:DNA polymerase-3 subunit chi